MPAYQGGYIPGPRTQAYRQRQFMRQQYQAQASMMAAQQQHRENVAYAQWAAMTGGAVAVGAGAGYAMAPRGGGGGGGDCCEECCNDCCNDCCDECCDCC